MSPTTVPKTSDLFPDAPIPEPRSMLDTTPTPGIRLSATQRAFQQLVADIETAEKRMGEITVLIDTYRPKFQQKLQPLQEELDRINHTMVVFLDQQLLKKGWTVNQRTTMKDIACYSAELLFGTAFHQEAEAILDRHADLPALDPTEDSAALKTDIEELFGVKLASDANTDPLSPEAMLAEAMRLLEEKEQDADRNRNKADAHAASKRGGSGGRKSAKQIQAEQQAIDANKMLKDIYRKLTSALHPDRELDAAERVRKTALMSEVNKAYASQNLLALLQLQLKANRLDLHASTAMADDKLKLINHTLKQQFKDLQAEWRFLETTARHEFFLNFPKLLNTENLQKSLTTTVAGEKKHLKNMRLDLADIQKSDASFKAWLKDQRQMMKEDALYDINLEKIMMSKPKKRR